jgi:hypothetical protein
MAVRKKVPNVLSGGDFLVALLATVLVTILMPSGERNMFKLSVIKERKTTKTDSWSSSDFESA